MNFNRSIKLSDKSYVQIYNADESLLSYIKQNFDDIFALHPVHENNKKSTIMHFDTSSETPHWDEVETKRWHKNGDLILMCGDFQNEYLHGVYKAVDGESKRIGISFRQFK